MAFIKQINIGGPSAEQALPLARQVQESLNELATKQEAQVAQERAMLAEHVWISGNLIEQNGYYLPQLSLCTAGEPSLLEAALRHVRAAGFGGEGWVIQREQNRIALRGLKPYTGPQAGFISLSGLIWEACERTTLPYGTPVY